MMDGIDSYKGHEINWAVGTVIENAEGVGLENFNGAKEMVAAVYEFIVENFDEEGLPSPSQDQLIKSVNDYFNSIED